MPINPRLFDPLIRLSLAEDAARQDATSYAILPRNARLLAAIIAKDKGILAGIDIARRVFQFHDPSLLVKLLKRDGSPVKPGSQVLLVKGPAHAIFAAERTALNFLGHLSGVATLTRAYVDCIQGTSASILDTRKTLPGLRHLEKYAVAVGGGKNHRANLAGAILIKTNHLRIAYSVQRIADKKKYIQEVIQKARKRAKGKFIEVEVTNLQEFRAALEAHPDALLLDNWPITGIRKAILYAKRYPLSARPLLEVSGGVTLANVRAIAKSGVDRISIGRLTHSAPSLDVALRVL